MSDGIDSGIDGGSDNGMDNSIHWDLLAGWTHNIVNGPARRVDGGIDDRVDGGRDSGWAGEQQPMEWQQQHQPAASTIRLQVSFRLRERQ